MLKRRLCLGFFLVCAAAARGQGTRPSGGSPARLDGAELAGLIDGMVRMLPSIDAVVTSTQQAAGAQACKLYSAGYPQRAEMGGLLRLRLGLLGLHGGFAAGDAEAMLSGAKLLMQEARKSKLEGYARYALAWAGIFGAEPATAAAALNGLIARPSQKGIGQWAKGMLPIAKQCNQPVMLTLSFPDGRRGTLAEYRGKAVVLDFWAGWSKPWVEHLPELKEFCRQRLSGGDFAIIGIAIHEKASEAKAAAAKHGLTWPVVWGPSARERFHGKGAPHVVVVSPTGRVLWQGHPIAKSTFTTVADFARRQAARMREAPAPRTRPQTTSAPAGGERPPAADAAAEARARQQLKLALAYRQAGLNDKARALFRAILKEHPRTAAAAKARAELSRVP